MLFVYTACARVGSSFSRAQAECLNICTVREKSPGCNDTSLFCAQGRERETPPREKGDTLYAFTAALKKRTRPRVLQSGSGRFSLRRRGWNALLRSPGLFSKRKQFFSARGERQGGKGSLVLNRNFLARRKSCGAGGG